jgi:isoamyl acetate esterase
MILKLQLLYCCTLLLFASCAGSGILLRNGDRIIFFGDSITQLGVKPGGYVSLITDSLRRVPEYASVEIIGAGISGNKVTDLQNRLQRDVLDKKPNLVVVYIGINDVWHSILPNHHGTPKDTFGILLKKIVTEIQQNGAKVILCTPSVVGEKHNGTNQLDSLLDEYADVGRRIAGETGSPLCDLRKAFIGYLSQHNLRNEEMGILTYDKVHLSDAGNAFVAREILHLLLNNN